MGIIQHDSLFGIITESDPMENLITVSTAQKYMIQNGWNMISVPVIVEDVRKVIIFPQASSDAFAYEGTYVVKVSLKCGIGYWLKFPTNGYLNIFGIPTEVETVTVNEGWNLIGSISKEIALSSLTSNPPGIVASQLFGFNGNYIDSDSIKSGKGYWIKVNQSGQSILSSEKSGCLTSRIKIVPISELPPPPPGED